jgi:dTDP-3,4-didehydro-2,6-dideoxy-alpha-D-glucose 3-reductase
MKILVLGYSNLARRKIIPAIKKIKNISFDIASLSSKKKNIGEDKWYNNYDVAINHTDANIVYVSLVNSLHYCFAKKSLSLGKNVIVDKPIALNTDKILFLIKLAFKNKVLISEALTFGYHRQFAILKNIINQNNAPSNIVMRFNIPKPAIGNHKLSKRLGGGCFNDMSPYMAEINRVFLKKNIKIKLITATNANKLNESFLIFSANKNTNFYGYFSHNSEYENSIQFSSSTYSVNLDRFCSPPPTESLLVTFKKKNQIFLIKSKKDDTFVNFLKEYIENIKKKKIKFYNKKIIFNYKFIDNIRKKIKV